MKNIVAVALGIFLIAPIQAQEPIGNEFQIRAGSTWPLAISAAGNEGFVVAFRDSGVQALRLSPSGQAVGAEFQVDTVGLSHLSLLSSATDQDGGFVVVWESEGSPGSDSSLRSIQARRYDSSDTPVGPQFQVNSLTLLNQIRPQVAMEPGGTFVVVWVSQIQFRNYNVEAQRFDAQGTTIGQEFRVNTLTGDLVEQPKIATSIDGSFVIVWRHAPDIFMQGEILGRRYDPSGVAEGGDFRVSLNTTQMVHFPSVVMGTDSSFLVCWLRDTVVVGRRFDSTGDPASGVMVISETVAMHWNHLGLAIDPFGRSVVTWDHDSEPEGPIDTANIRFAKAILPSTSGLTQFQVNDYTTLHSSPPAVAMLDDGTTLVIWNGWSPQDGNSLRGRLYTAPTSLFGDGFESGDTSEWSETVP